MIDSGATFSSCKKFRYRLWRVWDTAKPPAIFILLNPSTADEVANDPTVARCQARAFALGYGRLEILNIFAYRSTDPKALYDVTDPVGPGNDDAIRDCLEQHWATAGARVICGWGKNGHLSGRGRHVLALVGGAGFVANCLKQNSDGSPQHPLYLAYSLQPRPMVRYVDGIPEQTSGAEHSAAAESRQLQIPSADKGLFDGKTN